MADALFIRFSDILHNRTFAQQLPVLGTGADNPRWQAYDPLQRVISGAHDDKRRERRSLR